MVYMGFLPFLYLLIISIIVSVVLYFLLKIKQILPGGYPVCLMLGYIGAWIGTPVFGKWEFLTIGEISVIPAILGAIAAIFLVKSCAESCKKYKGESTA